MRNPMGVQRQETIRIARQQAVKYREMDPMALPGDATGAGGGTDAGAVDPDTGEIWGYGLLDITPFGDGTGPLSEEFIVA